MRALTVQQPWAWAIIHGGKDVENRSRNLAGSYRGLIAIHAGLAPFQKGNLASAVHRLAHGSETPTEIVFGGIIGVATLVAVHPSQDCSIPGCHLWGLNEGQHLVLVNPRPIAQPIPAKGRLGLWTPDQDLLEQINQQLTTTPEEN